MKSPVSVLLIALGGAVLAASSQAQPQPPANQAPSTTKATGAGKAKPTGDPYPLATCPVSGEKLGSKGEPIVKSYQGREVRFCGESCPPEFEKDLAKNLAKLDEAIIKDQLPLYPLTTSPVTGQALPEKPVDFVHGHRLVRVGAEGERAEFLKDPAKLIAELDKAVIAAQAKDYPLKACPVSEEELGSMGKPKDMVVAGRLVRLCCGSCVKDVRKQPARIIALIDEARKAGAGAKQPDKK